MDVKYVPKACYTGTDDEKFYQHTVIEEAGRERFIYAYKEHSSYSMVDFLQRAIIYFGYAPDMIQTDNGSEFTYTSKATRVHPPDALSDRLHIIHKTIRPATLWHDGKVARSHRSDRERFYNFLRFYSYEDLQLRMKRYLRRSNRIPMSVLDCKSPLWNRQEPETDALRLKLFPFFRSHITNK